MKMLRIATIMALAATLLSCATRDDDYQLLRRITAADSGPGTRLALASRNDGEASYVRHLLASGFGAELLRTYAMTKRFAARTAGYRETPTTIVLGVPESPAQRTLPRQAQIGWWRTTIESSAPIIWIDDSGERRAGSTMAGVVSGLGGAIVDVVGPHHHPADWPLSAWGPPPLRQGYVDFLQVVAAEWRPPSDTDDRDDLRDGAFADVRANGAVLRRQDRSPRGMIDNSEVVATVLYRLASSDLGRRMADPHVYAPFLDARPPRGVHPALLLGAFRNFQAKLLSAWSQARAAGRPPQDLIDLIEAYGEAYPAERAEATRIFLVTTYGATVLPAAVRADQAPERVETQLASLTADVLFGRRGLRDALTDDR